MSSAQSEVALRIVETGHPGIRHGGLVDFCRARGAEEARRRGQPGFPRSGSVISTPRPSPARPRAHWAGHSARGGEHNGQARRTRDGGVRGGGPGVRGGAGGRGWRPSHHRCGRRRCRRP
ncbi:MAG: hypothetical protein MZV64_34335 [Ignavibacteriales bacterium]|nr:hypothetical protein [Ignavibacteriales bacterium]